MNSLEPGSHMLAKKTAYLFDTDFSREIFLVPYTRTLRRGNPSFVIIITLNANDEASNSRKQRKK